MNSTGHSGHLSHGLHVPPATPLSKPLSLSSYTSGIKPTHSLDNQTATRPMTVSAINATIVASSSPHSSINSHRSSSSCTFKADRAFISQHHSTSPSNISSRTGLNQSRSFENNTIVDSHFSKGTDSSTTLSVTFVPHFEMNHRKNKIFKGGKYSFNGKLMPNNICFTNEIIHQNVSNNPLSTYNRIAINRTSSYQPSLPSPVEGGCSLVWSNLSYSVECVDLQLCNPLQLFKRDQRLILNQLSGHVNSGELVALIGPSGVGKSTLLEILAGRRRRGVQGDVYLAQRTQPVLSVHKQRHRFNPTLHYPFDSGHLQHSYHYQQTFQNPQQHPRQHAHHFTHRSNASFELSPTRRAIQDASIAFIAQKDHHLTGLTIGETLMYASRLKNCQRARQACKTQTLQRSPPLLSIHSEGDFHRLLVHSVLNDLGLLDAQHTQVGKCSGGQKRRLSIAVELLSQPSLILMDEPTTGLDFVSAFKCIQTLRSLTLMRHPPGIITSIHQPSSVVLSQFNRVYTLAKGGRCLYEGAVQSMVSHLGDFHLRCPLYFNPADFAIQVASGDFGLTYIDQLVEHQRKCHEHAHQPLRQLPHSHSNVGQQSGIIRQSLTELRDRLNQPTGSLLTQAFLLIQRNWRCTWRQPTLSWLRIFQFVFTAVLIANLHNYPVGQVDGCFSDLQARSVLTPTTNVASESNSITSSITGALSGWLSGIGISTLSSSKIPEDQIENMTEESLYANSSSNLALSGEQYVQQLARVKDNSILLFFSLMFWVMSSIVPTLLTFPAEMLVFRQERSNGWYGCLAYYVAKTFVEAPFVTVCPFLFCIIFYPMTGQINVWWRFSLFYLIALLLCLIAQTLGLIVGSVFADDKLSAIFIGSVQSFPLFMVGGYLIRGSVVSVLVRPLWQISYVRFAFSALILSVYGFGRCPAPTTHPTLLPTIGSFNNNPHNPHNYSAPPSSKRLLNQVRALMDEEDFNCLHDSYYTNAGYQVDQLLSRCNLSLPALFIRQPLDPTMDGNNSIQTYSQANSESTIYDNSFVLSYYEVTNDTFVYSIGYLGGTLLLLMIINYLLIVRNARKESRL